MKKVFSNDEVPHLWMHQSQEQARNSNGTLYFNGAIIYSYGEHFPIAAHVQNANGERAILVTTDRYSVTTGVHISRVRQAIPDYCRCIYVPMHDQSPARPQGILDRLNSELFDAIEEIATAKNKVSRAKRMAAAGAIQETARTFAAFFALSGVHEIPATVEEIKTAIAARVEVERQRRAKEIADAQKEARRREKKDAARIAAWMRGENVGSIHYTADTKLRVIGDEVETSRGASFPVTHARRGLALVRSVMARGQEWHSNGHTCKLGHYQIDRISADGTVYAGCHEVTWKEIERIAPQLETTRTDGRIVVCKHNPAPGDHCYTCAAEAEAERNK
jgi:hypothetical protein